MEFNSGKYAVLKATFYKKVYRQVVIDDNETITYRNRIHNNIISICVYSPTFLNKISYSDGTHTSQ
jgi:hypothetical protein